MSRRKYNKAKKDCTKKKQVYRLTHALKLLRFRNIDFTSVFADSDSNNITKKEHK